MATNVTVDCTDVTIVTGGTQGPQGPAGPQGPPGTVGNLNDIGDVTITSVSDGQVLTYDSGSGEWINLDPAGGDKALNDLTDVTITTPANNDLLAYNSTSGEWENLTNSYVTPVDSINWTGDHVFTGNFNVGDPGTESGSVLVNGTPFPAIAKINRFGSATEAELIIHRHSTTDNAHFLFSRALSNDATHADVINGTSLGDTVYTGWNTNSYWLGGIIRGSVDGTPSLGGMPTRLDFFTSAVGSATPTLRFSIRADGTIQLNGDLDVNGNPIISNSAGNIVITPDTTGSVVLDGLNWPQADGALNDVLTTDGTGNLIFSPVASVGGGSANIRYRFDSAITATDPGAGNFKINNADASLATEIYASADAGNLLFNDMTALFNRLESGDHFYIQNINDSGESFLALINTITDNTGWFTFGITVESAGTDTSWSNNDVFGWIIAYTGTRGLSEVKDDPSPQLGGDLDRNGFDITGYTASRALQTSVAGAIEVSAVTSTELGYSSGVTSAIQTQIDGKEPAFTKNTAFNKDFGAIAGTVCEGDDSRLSDNRTDADAIHDNVSGEISLITEKTAPVGADLILIEDSAATNAKKRIQIGNLPGSSINDNLIINPSFRIWQRATSFTTASGYTSDRWEFTDVGAGVVTVSRSTGGPTGTQYAWEANVTTADASIAAGDLYTVNQPIEGSNIHETRIGTASAESVTITFDVYSAVTGTHCISLRNSAANRSYVAEYTVNSANTWETKSITIALDTTGTWLYDIGIGLNVTWCLAGGSTFQTTAGSWTAGNFVCSSNQVNVMGTLANKFRLSDVKVEIGIQSTLFRSLLIEQEIEACQRYYEKSYNLSVAPGSVSVPGIHGGRQSGTGNYVGVQAFSTRKRTTPSMTGYRSDTGASGSWLDFNAATGITPNFTNASIPTSEYEMAVVVTAVADANFIGGHWTADSEL